MMRIMFKDQCGVIFGSCARWQCPTASAPGRPWCSEHEILSAEEQGRFVARQNARGALDWDYMVQSLVKWRRKLLH